MRRQRIHRFPSGLSIRFGLLALVAVMILIVAGSERASAHAELRQSEPPSEGLLTVPPRQIDLWFTETVASGEGLPSVKIVDAGGNDVPVASTRIDPADGAHVIAEIDGLLPGTYTVIWSVRSEVDGHTLSGTYSFRLGGGRAPGAATVEGETPPAWAVLTRWLTFLGISLAASGFVFGAYFLAPGTETERSTRHRRLLIVGGVAVALVATLLEPVLQTRWPPAGTIAPSLEDAVQALPAAWWVRPAALAPLLVLALVVWRSGRQRHPLDWPLAVAALTALLGLSLTSHSAAEQGFWHWPAIASNVLHQWSIALWIGGLAQLALWWTGRRGQTETDSDERATSGQLLRGFSRAAVVLVGIGVATGIANAGMLLPAVRSLWTSDYGIVLLVKVAVLTVPLALATFHQRTIRKALIRFWPVLQRTVRLEAALVLAVVLGGSTLALLSPPLTASRVSVTADVPKPALNAVDGQNLLVHLLYSPGLSGDNSLGLRIANYDYSAYAGVQPVRVRLRLVSLDQDLVNGPYELEAAPDGTWSAPGTVEFPFDGWWRIEATLRWLGQEDVIVPFYIMLPDPNLNGFDAPVTPASDSEAAALYDRAMAVYTGWHTVRFSQSMSSHTGVTAFAQHVVNDGSDGSTPGYSYTAVGGFDAVVIGTTGWMKREGEDWRVIEVNPMIPPAEWDDEYIGATGFQLGRIDDVNGEPAQVLTFVVPGNGKQVTAWYVWWIGLESGQMLRDVMVSNGHYMTTDFSGFDEAAPLSPPPGVSATPVP